LKPGDRVERYLIRHVLGRGGMGEVYEAYDSRLGRAVALKVLHDVTDTSTADRLLREARAAAAFEHPNVVVVFDVGVVDGLAYMAMELVKGRQLRDFVGDRRVTLMDRLRWLVDAARALGAAHAAGLVHRDIKPENLMIADNGQLKVLDFGVARLRPEDVTPAGPTSDARAPDLSTLSKPGQFIGTPVYSSPEQLLGQPIDARSDQFSWAVTAYEVLTGTLPWTGPPFRIVGEILSGSPRPPSELVTDLPTGYEAVLMRSLAKTPADRFASMADAVVLLERALEGLPRSSNPSDALPPSVSAFASAVPPSSPAGDGSGAPPSSAEAKREAGGRALPRWLPLVGALGLAVAAVVGFGNGTHKKASSAPAALPLVARVHCRSASLRGAPELERAVGIGACARLATELGVAWDASPGVPALLVTGGVDRDKTTLALEIDGRKAEGTGSAPLEAVEHALGALTKKLAAPPVSSARTALWFAKSPAGARALERAFTRFSLRLTEHPEADATELTRLEPDSPWSYLLLALTAAPGSATYLSAIDAGLARLNAVPAPRALALRAHFIVLRDKGSLKEAVADSRRAYTQAPDDPDVMALHSYVLLSTGHSDEAIGLVERLSQLAPHASVRALRLVLTGLRERAPDPERDRRLLARMFEIFPESEAWPQVVDQWAANGLVAEAKRSVLLGEQLGIRRSASLGRVQAELALLSFDPEGARRAARVLIADPAEQPAARGAWLTISAYLLEGHVVEAQALQRREIDRQLATKNAAGADEHTAADLRYRRFLGQPPPDLGRLGEVAARLEARQNESDPLVPYERSEVALARLRAAARERAPVERLLGELEHAAEVANDDRARHDIILAGTVPLVRALRGDRAAAERWLATDHAEFTVRRTVAFDAALALEADRQARAAEAAYLVAKEPRQLGKAALEFVAAHVRLAALYRSESRAAEAEPLEAVIAHTWVHPDPGLAEAIRALQPRR
jgi:serine/threonine protein kinase